MEAALGARARPVEVQPTGEKAVSKHATHEIAREIKPPAQWERGGIKLTEFCPCCAGHPGSAEEFSRRDDGFIFEDVWTLRRCSRCRSIWLVNRPDSESLRQAYESYYTHSAPAEGAGKDGLVAAGVNGYLNLRFRLARRPAALVGALALAAVPPLAFKLNIYGRHVPRCLIERGGRLLDVGCGNGDFLEIAREMGLDVTGCEPDPKAAEVSRARGFSVFDGSIHELPYGTDTFDFISMNHVIEHVEDPQEVLGAAYRLLKPGGLLWLGLPNPQALGIRIFGPGWKGFHPPYHLVIPSRNILRDWLTGAGFSRVDTLRRGAQSTGLWRESLRISQREAIDVPAIKAKLFKLVSDLGATIFPLWSEELLIVGRKGGGR